MAEEETVTEGQEAPGEAGDLEEECRALYVQVQEAQSRLRKIAASEQEQGHASVAGIYREIAGTVLTLILDLTATSGGGFADIEEDIGRLYVRSEGGEPTESVLLEEDSKEYVAYFEQILRLLQQLKASASGDTAQQQIFDTLIRMTEDRMEFTKEITLEEEPDAEGDDPDEKGEGDGTS